MAWSSNAKFLAAVNLRKKAAAPASKPPGKLKPSSSQQQQQHTAVVKEASLVPSFAGSVAADVAEEYDPSRPNEYDDYLAYIANQKTEGGFSLKRLEAFHNKNEDHAVKKLFSDNSSKRSSDSRSTEKSYSYGPARFSSSATSVLVLMNMAAIGHVDADLEAEAASECQKYGRVLACDLREQPTVTSEEEAVQIFVKYQDRHAAQRAADNLDGRFFGGRTIRATFYDERTYEVEFAK